MLKDGLRNVAKETINGAVTLEQGTVPKWLSGMVTSWFSFLFQSEQANRIEVIRIAMVLISVKIRTHYFGHL